jgi:transposase
MDTKVKDTSGSPGLNWRNKSRRRYTPEERLAMVQECAEPGVSVSEVAQRNRVNTNLLFKWCRLHKGGQLVVPSTSVPLLPVTVVKPKSKRARRASGTHAASASSAGAIEIELPGARIYLHGTVSEARLEAVLKALARR